MEGYKKEFENKNVLVTGGSRGIGKAISTALHNFGAKVTVLGKNLENLQALKSELPSIDIICVDITDWDATRKALEGQSFDILVNNAGVSTAQNFLEVTSDSFDLVMGTNLKSVFNVSQVVAQDMIEKSGSGPKSIVNISSLTSTSVVPFSAIYSCSKAALDMLTKVMAAELGPHGIRVNSVNPGGVMTDMISEGMKTLIEKGVNCQDVFESMAKRNLLIGTGPTVPIENVVNTVLFALSSSLAGSTTGHHFVIDNGYTVS